jgi:hypothetical protein
MTGRTRCAVTSAITVRVAIQAATAVAAASTVQARPPWPARAGVVPLSGRRPMWHFLGLWATFVAGFSFMVPGIEMHDGGFSLAATIGTSLLGYGIYLAYALVGSYLGSRTGQTLTLLTRRAVFGRVGSWLVSLLVMIPALGWVGFQAGVLAQLWHGFFGWGHLAVTTTALAAVMIFSNLFGFAGISLFARYVVTPVLAVWCAYLVIKGLAAGAASGPGGSPHGRHLAYWVAVAGRDLPPVRLLPDRVQRALRVRRTRLRVQSGQQCEGPHSFGTYCPAVDAVPHGFAAVKFGVGLDGRMFYPCP